jgi:hypothetical protein
MPIEFKRRSESKVSISIANKTFEVTEWIVEK